MAKGALFVGWGALIPGREAAARRVLGDAMQYLQRLQQAGTIDSFEAVALEPHGGGGVPPRGGGGGGRLWGGGGGEPPPPAMDARRRVHRQHVYALDEPAE